MWVKNETNVGTTIETRNNVNGIHRKRLVRKFKCIDKGNKEDIRRDYWVNAAVAGQQLAKISTR